MLLKHIRKQDVIMTTETIGFAAVGVVLIVLGFLT